MHCGLTGQLDVRMRPYLTEEKRREMIAEILKG
jgi:hypothetical protein